MQLLSPYAFITYSNPIKKLFAQYFLGRGRSFKNCSFKFSPKQRNEGIGAFAF